MPPKGRRRKAAANDVDDVSTTATTTSSRPSRKAKVNYAEDKDDDDDDDAENDPPARKRGRRNANAKNGSRLNPEAPVSTLNPNASVFVPRGPPPPAPAAVKPAGDDPVANGTDATTKTTKRGRGAKQKSAGVKAEPKDDGDQNNNGTDAKGKSGTDAKGSKSKGGAKKGKKESAAPVDLPPAPVTKSIVMKSKAPVDEECPVKDSCHVLCEGDDIWDCMLNQTDVGNNNNKYYLIQCLESDANDKYYCWQRWGRVGKIAGTNLVACGQGKAEAQRVFEKKFQDKTKNSWEERWDFQKVKGKYDLLEMDYSPSVDAEPATKVKEESGEEVKKEVESKLDDKIQDLIKLIFDVKKMTETVVEMQYDANKAPLGKMTKDQIRLGYEALKIIEDCIVKNKTGTHQHVEACNQFYTRIPHDFGMKRPPLIGDMTTIKSKISLLEVLGDIQIAMTLMSSSFRAMGDKHVLDHRYDSLRCAITSVDKNSQLFDNVGAFVRKTHGKTHAGYTLDVEEVFELDKSGERETFNPSGLENRRLLWHGSRLTNWSGILGQGLRIAPPEAPVTGYMFGKGVYFADMCSKSANYCFTTPTKNIGLILLCEVALGEMNELTNADYNAASLPKGKHSTWGQGRTVPDDKEFYNLEDGTLVPSGGATESKANTSLQYNEFIVYNTNQVRMRYLIKLKFNYKYGY